jgi:2-keto-4-pentenoate hydratase
MPLSPERFAQARRWFDEHIAANRKVPELLTAFPEATDDDGYRLLFAEIDRRLAAGERIIGYKAAVTAKPMQAFFGVNEPCAGILTSSALVTSGRISISRWIQANVEPEIAFLLGKPLEGPNAGVLDVMAATEGVMGALEIGHLRTGVEKRSMATFLGLNTLNGAVVLGDRIVDSRGLDLRLEGMSLEVDGEPAGSGCGVEALGDPRAVVAWVANLLARYNRRLEAGTFVITGSLVQGPLMQPGKTVRARYTHLGEVGIRFEE